MGKHENLITYLAWVLVIMGLGFTVGMVINYAFATWGGLIIWGAGISLSPNLITYREWCR